MPAPLQWQNVPFPFGIGLDQKTDPRAITEPSLAVCLDAQFDQAKGIQTRPPFAVHGTNITGGGTLSNMRRIVESNGELLLFTDVALYSWSAQLVGWVLKGSYLAAEVTEKSVAVRNADQISQDRAELANVIVYTWTDTGTAIWVSVVDKVTGAVITAPAGIATGVRPRVVALATRILLFFGVHGTGLINVVAIDPANIATSLATTPTLVVNTGRTDPIFDVTRVIGVDQAVMAAPKGASYVVATVTAGLTIATASKARTADTVIGCSSTPDGLSVQIVRTSTTNVQGDLLTVSTLADVFTATAIGTTTGFATSQIACAHRSVQNGGAYRCYAWWSISEVVSTYFEVKTNHVDTANAVGSQSTFQFASGIASRAFDYSGQVYFWMGFGQPSSFSGIDPVFGAAVQNSYFLYRDDGLLIAKSTYENAGGLVASVGLLPGVALTAGSTTFSWCGLTHRIIPTAAQNSYGARAPRDVTFTFDSNDTRRSVRLGNTLYIVGAEGCLQYDGAQLTEVGFHVFPWNFGAIGIVTGSLANATYGYKSTLRWDNAAGDRDRSTTATIGTITLSGGTPQGVSIVGAASLQITHKVNGLAPPTVEYWRTIGNPPEGAPFYLVTSLDPAALTNPNRYIPNDSTASSTATFNDQLADASITGNEINPENGAILENLAAPAASIIASTANRVFLAGVSGQPNTVWYSKLRADGDVIAFNDALTFQVPLIGGPIVAIGFVNETAIVWCETACYAVDGQGFDNSGGGSNYGPARLLSANIGCVSAESVARTPSGLMFKGAGGWYFVDQGWRIQYVGAPVDTYVNEDVQSVVCMEDRNQVRILSSERLLIWDYLVDQWAEWSIAGGLSACIWQGQYVYLTAAGPMIEGTFATATPAYGLDVETGWFAPAGQQGRCTVMNFSVLGEVRSAFVMRIRIARDYQTAGGAPVWIDDVLWPVTPTTVGGPLQVRPGPSQKRCEAIKVRLTAMALDGVSAPSSECMRLTGLSFYVGTEPGPYSGLSAGQKV